MRSQQEPGDILSVPKYIQHFWYNVPLDATSRAYLLKEQIQEGEIHRIIEERTFQERADCLRRM